ncbi:hypothetical protein HYD70_00830 [Mycoplasmopsis bovis]|nr:hypothetical protein [Mycoplasmopsis bovis]QQH49694.1 hypothetical protein HYD70_00830 [Mycoplasmopsis bovis]
MSSQTEFGQYWCLAFFKYEFVTHSKINIKTYSTAKRADSKKSFVKSYRKQDLSELTGIFVFV